MTPQPCPYDPLGVSLADLSGAEVVRHCEMLAAPIVADGTVTLTVRGREGPSRLSFAGATRLKLSPTGPRRHRSLVEYTDTLEAGRAVDVLGRRTDSGFQPLAFWCSARYHRQRMNGSRKPDCEFVLTLASAAKDERIAARHLQRLGHELRGEAVEDTRPYTVVLAAARGGRVGKADLKCAHCGLRLEVKGRPNDCKLRFSDSPSRRFADENRPQDYQVMVMRHETVRVFSNADIIDDWAQATPAGNGVDRWVEFSQEWGRSRECLPPACTGPRVDAGADDPDAGAGDPR